MLPFRSIALAGVFAVSQSLFAQAPAAAPAGAAADPAADPAAGGRGRGGARGGGAPALNGLVAPMLAQGDSDGDGALSKTEAAALAASWFERLDTAKAGQVTQAEFVSRLPGIIAGTGRAGGAAPAADPALANPAPANPGAAPRGGRGGGANPALGLFLSVDVDGDGAATRWEFTNFFDKWYVVWDKTGTGRLGQDALNAGLSATLPAADAEVMDFTKRPPVLPQTPEAEQKLFLLPPGYKMELVLSDPQIQDPVGVSWDGNGRMYVLEMRSYMLDANGTDSRKPISRVSRWEDTDGDGKYDKSTIFADNLVLPRMAHPLGKDAVLILETDNMDLYKYTDTNGDGVSDKKEVFFPAFGRVTNMEWQPGGNLVWALDNWMYSSYNPFRIRLTPQGKVIREETAPNGGQWSAAQDNHGKVWFVDGGGENGPVNVQQPIIYGAFNAGPTVDDNFEPGYRTVWGAAVATADMQGGMRRVRMPEGSLNHMTAAAGSEIYRGHRLPADLVGDLLWNEPVGRLVRRTKVVVTDGITQLQNAYPRSEFIRSTDPIFRPVNTQNAPDGTLFISDMYTGIIQDAQFVGPGSYLARRADQFGLDKIFNKGRIWRLTNEIAEPDRTQPRMLDETAVQLVAHLEHPSGWWRDTAQELLVLKQDKSAVPALTTMLRGSSKPLARIHALWTLEGLEALTPALTREMLRSQDPAMRVQALRASETLYKAGDKSFAADYGTLAKDPEVSVAIQALLTASLMNIPDQATLTKTMRDTSTSRGVKSVASQLLVPGVALGQPTQSNTGSDPFMALPTEQRRLMNQGQATYRELCITCHGADGRGAPLAGAAPGILVAPPMAGSSRVTGHRDYVINVLLKGLTGPLQGTTYEGGVMVPMGANTDEWIASVASYVRNTFGNAAGFVSAADVATVRAAQAARTRPWTLAELEPLVPVQVGDQAQWKATASENAATAMNAILTAPTPAATPAAAPGGARGGGGGRGGAGAAQPRWDTGVGQRAGMWYQVELPQVSRLVEIQLDAPAAAGGRGAAPVRGPVQYRVQVSNDGATWGAPVAEGAGLAGTTVISFKPVDAKFVRITQTSSEDNAPIWAIQRVRLFKLP